MQHTTIAIDLAKSVFEIAVSRHPGKVSERHLLPGGRFLAFSPDATQQPFSWKPAARPTNGPGKSIDQQALVALHRRCSAWLAARTARINDVRVPVREFGITIPLGARRVVPLLQQIIGDPAA